MDQRFVAAWLPAFLLQAGVVYSAEGRESRLDPALQAQLLAPESAILFDEAAWSPPRWAARRIDQLPSRLGMAALEQEWSAHLEKYGPRLEAALTERCEVLRREGLREQETLERFGPSLSKLAEPQPIQRRLDALEKEVRQVRGVAEKRAVQLERVLEGLSAGPTAPVLTLLVYVAP